MPDLKIFEEEDFKKNNSFLVSVQILDNQIKTLALALERAEILRRSLDDKATNLNKAIRKIENISNFLGAKFMVQDKPIDFKILSGRASNALRTAKCETNYDLLNKSDSYFLKYPKLGRKTLNEIKEYRAQVFKGFYDA